MAVYTKVSESDATDFLSSYDLGNGLTAYARIDNLLNRHYQDPIGFLRPGLGVFAGSGASQTGWTTPTTAEVDAVYPDDYTGLPQKDEG